MSLGFLLKMGLPLLAVATSLYLLVRKIHLHLIKRKDEDFRHIAESIPQMLWSTDSQGDTRYFNKRWYEYFGLPQTENHNLNWRQYVHPDDLDRIVSRWNRALAEKRPYENEYRLKGKDGQYKWFLSRGIPIKSRDDKIIKWIGTATDIHQNKEAIRTRDELLNLLDQEISTRKIQQAELERAIKTRDDFISMASHELKTPLTSLQLQTQMSKKIISKEGAAGFPAEKLTKLIRTFDNQVTRLAKLTEDMLYVVKINQGVIPIDLEVADLTELVTETVEKFNSGSGRPKEQEISLTAVKGQWVSLDRFRIEQVIFNLLSNATKFGQGTPVHVEVLQEGDRAKILVHDGGPGIALENQQRIFKPFERASSSRQISGLGLGLHIVSQIVTAHGGEVRVDSTLGKGATFIVELPIAGAIQEPLLCPPDLNTVAQVNHSLVL